MDGYLLITGLKQPTELQSRLADSMPAAATTLVVPPDSVRLELRRDANFSDAATLDWIVRLIMQGVKDCGEMEAQMGFFAD